MAVMKVVLTAVWMAAKLERKKAGWKVDLLADNLVDNWVED